MFGIDVSSGTKSPNPTSNIADGLKLAAGGSGYVNTVKLGELRKLSGWKELRFWCKKPSIGRVVHIKTSDPNVIAYFTAQTNTFPKAPGSFTAYSDDTSNLAKQPAEWGYVAGKYNTGTWGHDSIVTTDDRLSNHAFFIGGKYHWYLDGGSRMECDDMQGATQGNWYVWVR